MVDELKHDGRGKPRQVSAATQCFVSHYLSSLKAAAEAVSAGAAYGSGIHQGTLATLEPGEGVTIRTYGNWRLTDMHIAPGDFNAAKHWELEAYFRL